MSRRDRNPLDCQHHVLTDLAPGVRPLRLACWACGTPLEVLRAEADEPDLFNTLDPTSHGGLTP